MAGEVEFIAALLLTTAVTAWLITKLRLFLTNEIEILLYHPLKGEEMMWELSALLIVVLVSLMVATLFNLGLSAPLGIFL